MRLLLVLLLAGCPKPTPVETPNALAESQAWVVHDSGLRHEDLVVGTGTLVTSGSRVLAHYTGWLHDGTKFDSSHDRGEPLAITVDAGQVIKGWDEGLQGMREGGKRKLLIPPNLGYGSADMGFIPPNSVLTFEVEMVEVQAPRKPAAAPMTVASEDYRQTESGLLIADIGGDCTPLEHPAGARLDVEYDGFLESGRLFDSTRLRETAFTFPIGMGRVIPGWDEGLADAPVGCRRQLVVPPHLAYGEAGNSKIPPAATLTFDIEVIDIGAPRVAPMAPQTVNGYLTSGTGLKVAIIEAGEGDAVAKGDTALVEYTGWTSDGTRFDSSYLRDGPIPVQVGAGRVIAGWDEGLLGMKVGELRQLVIPPNLGYGATGRPPTIPGGETLTFEVQLVERHGGQ